jgi:hypothetical protein
MLEQLQKLKLDHKGHVLDPMPDYIWAIIAEAAIFSDLAKAPKEVGVAAGDWIADQVIAEEKRKEESMEMAAKLFGVDNGR